MQSLCLKGPWPHKRFASSSQLLYLGFKGQPCLLLKDVQSLGFLCMMVKSRGDGDASAGSQLYCQQPADDLLVVYEGMQDSCSPSWYCCQKAAVQRLNSLDCSQRPSFLTTRVAQFALLSMHARLNPWSVWDSRQASPQLHWRKDRMNRCLEPMLEAAGKKSATKLLLAWLFAVACACLLCSGCMCVHYLSTFFSRLY